MLERDLGRGWSERFPQQWERADDRTGGRAWPRESRAPRRDVMPRAASIAVTWWRPTLPPGTDNGDYEFRYTSRYPVRDSLHNLAENG